MTSNVSDSTVRLRAGIPITWYSPVPTIQSVQETWNDKESIHKQSYKIYDYDNDENTYIGMSLPEGIRYITVFEKGILKTAEEYSGHSTVRKTG